MTPDQEREIDEAVTMVRKERFVHDMMLAAVHPSAGTGVHERNMWLRDLFEAGVLVPVLMTASELSMSEVLRILSRGSLSEQGKKRVDQLKHAQLLLARTKRRQAKEKAYLARQQQGDKKRLALRAQLEEEQRRG